MKLPTQKVEVKLDQAEFDSNDKVKIQFEVHYDVKDFHIAHQKTADFTQAMMLE